MFNLFVAHLTTELSSECLFSFIEFSQFRLLLESDTAFMETVNTYIKQHETTQCQFNPPQPIRKQTNSSKDAYDKIVLLNEEIIPLSDIVYFQNEGLESIQRYKRIIKQLLTKYIVDSAEFCINIDYATRSMIESWVDRHCNDDGNGFEPLQCYQMYCLFERCRKEMYSLMKHTLVRFVQTTKFKMLIKDSQTSPNESTV